MFKRSTLVNMNNIERYSKVHDVSFQAAAIGAADKESFLIGAEYVLDNLLPRFKQVSDEYPEPNTRFVYVTKNKRVGIMSNSTLSDWHIDKYSITHWMYVEDLLSLLPQ